MAFFISLFGSRLFCYKKSPATKKSQSLRYGFSGGDGDDRDDDGDGDGGDRTRNDFLYDSFRRGNAHLRFQTLR